MARTNSPIFQLVSGSLGDQLVFKHYYDKTIISKKPDMSRVVLSKKQLEWNQRMALATAYAKHICSTAEEKFKARVRLKVQAHKSVFRALVKEHLDTHKHLEIQDIV